MDTTDPMSAVLRWYAWGALAVAIALPVLMMLLWIAQ
jgi:hypothetical protein